MTKKDFKKGEIVTLLVIAATVVLTGVTILSSVFLQNKNTKLSSKSKASGVAETCFRKDCDPGRSRDGKKGNFVCIDRLADGSEKPGMPTDLYGCADEQGPAALPQGDPNSCPCDKKESCVDGRWCGNDCKWHDDNSYRCGANQKPTPAGSRDCNAPESCVNDRWCGNDYKYHDEMNDIRCNKNMPTVPPNAPKDCNQFESCVSGRWCGNDGKFHDEMNFIKNCQKKEAGSGANSYCRDGSECTSGLCVNNYCIEKPTPTPPPKTEIDKDKLIAYLNGSNSCRCIDEKYVGGGCDGWMRNRKCTSETLEDIIKKETALEEAQKLEQNKELFGILAELDDCNCFNGIKTGKLCGNLLDRDCSNSISPEEAIEKIKNSQVKADKAQRDELVKFLTASDIECRCVEGDTSGKGDWIGGGCDGWQRNKSCVPEKTSIVIDKVNKWLAQQPTPAPITQLNPCPYTDKNFCAQDCSGGCSEVPGVENCFVCTEDAINWSKTNYLYDSTKEFYKAISGNLIGSWLITPMMSQQSSLSQGCPAENDCNGNLVCAKDGLFGLGGTKWKPCSGSEICKTGQGCVNLNEETKIYSAQGCLPPGSIEMKQGKCFVCFTSTEAQTHGEWIGTDPELCAKYMQGEKITSGEVMTQAISGSDKFKIRSIGYDNYLNDSSASIGDKITAFGMKAFDNFGFHVLGNLGKITGAEQDSFTGTHYQTQYEVMKELGEQGKTYQLSAGQVLGGGLNGGVNYMLKLGHGVTLGLGNLVTGGKLDEITGGFVTATSKGIEDLNEEGLTKLYGNDEVYKKSARSTQSVGQTLTDVVTIMVPVGKGVNALGSAGSSRLAKLATNIELQGEKSLASSLKVGALKAGSKVYGGISKVGSAVEIVSPEYWAGSFIKSAPITTTVQSVAKAASLTKTGEKVAGFVTKVADTGAGKVVTAVATPFVKTGEKVVDIMMPRSALTFTPDEAAKYLARDIRSGLVTDAREAAERLSSKYHVTLKNVGEVDKLTDTLGRSGVRQFDVGDLSTELKSPIIRQTNMGARIEVIEAQASVQGPLDAAATAQVKQIASASKYKNVSSVSELTEQLIVEAEAKGLKVKIIDVQKGVAPVVVDTEVARLKALAEAAIAKRAADGFSRTERLINTVTGGKAGRIAAIEKQAVATLKVEATTSDIESALKGMGYAENKAGGAAKKLAETLRNEKMTDRILAISKVDTNQAVAAASGAVSPPAQGGPLYKNNRVNPANYSVDVGGDSLSLQTIVDDPAQKGKFAIVYKDKGGKFYAVRQNTVAQNVPGSYSRIEVFQPQNGGWLIKAKGFESNSPYLSSILPSHSSIDQFILPEVKGGALKKVIPAADALSQAQTSLQRTTGAGTGTAAQVVQTIPIDTAELLQFKNKFKKVYNPDELAENILYEWERQGQTVLIGDASQVAKAKQYAQDILADRNTGRKNFGIFGRGEKAAIERQVLDALPATADPFTIQRTLTSFGYVQDEVEKAAERLSGTLRKEKMPIRVQALRETLKDSTVMVPARTKVADTLKPDPANPTVKTDAQKALDEYNKKFKKIKDPDKLAEAIFNEQEIARVKQVPPVQLPDDQLTHELAVAQAYSETILRARNPQFNRFQTWLDENIARKLGKGTAGQEKQALTYIFNNQLHMFDDVSRAVTISDDVINATLDRVGFRGDRTAAVAKISQQARDVGRFEDMTGRIKAIKDVRRSSPVQQLGYAGQHPDELGKFTNSFRNINDPNELTEAILHELEVADKTIYTVSSAKIAIAIDFSDEIMRNRTQLNFGVRDTIGNIFGRGKKADLDRRILASLSPGASDAIIDSTLRKYGYPSGLIPEEKAKLLFKMQNPATRQEFTLFERLTGLPQKIEDDVLAVFKQRHPGIIDFNDAALGPELRGMFMEQGYPTSDRLAFGKDINGAMTRIGKKLDQQNAKLIAEAQVAVGGAPASVQSAVAAANPPVVPAAGGAPAVVNPPAVAPVTAAAASTQLKQKFSFWENINPGYKVRLENKAFNALMKDGIDATDKVQIRAYLKSAGYADEGIDAIIERTGKRITAENARQARAVAAGGGAPAQPAAAVAAVPTTRKKPWVLAEKMKGGKKDQLEARVYQEFSNNLTVPDIEDRIKARLLALGYVDDAAGLDGAIKNIIAKQPKPRAGTVPLVPQVQPVRPAQQIVAKQPQQILANYSVVDSAFRAGHGSNIELVEFWRGLTRDSEGRWVKYKNTTAGYFKGYQPMADLNIQGIKDYVEASINAKKAFVAGLQQGKINGSAVEFQEWIVNLHKEQAYKGKGGQIRTSRYYSAPGGHAPVINGDVVPLANKYGDPYLRQGTQIVDLPGISINGKPMDVYASNGWATHYYPGPEYFDEYFNMIQKTLQEAQAMGVRASSREYIEKVAEFYQYAINSRMFTEVNQSLFTNMANTLLEQRGLRPIEQGILDFTAMRLQPKNFQNYFFDEVQRVNRGI